ncbi:MAG: hypothetical protein KGL39_21690 [Patescibacteria group bacterium]|nr:hypothetical protein [Patescibacteria group bacterium]
MKRLELFKSASDFAFANIEVNDPAQIDIAGAQAFQAAKFDSKDYNLWKQYATQCRNQFLALAQQPVPSSIGSAQPMQAQLRSV